MQAAQHKFSGGAPGVVPEFMLLDSRNGNVVRIAAEVPLARTTANTQGLKVMPVRRTCPRQRTADSEGATDLLRGIEGGHRASAPIGRE